MKMNYSTSYILIKNFMLLEFLSFLNSTSVRRFRGTIMIIPLFKIEIVENISYQIIVD